MADVQQIVRVYGKKIRDSNILKRLAADAASYQDAHDYAAEAAEVLCDVLERFIDVSNIQQDEAIQILTAVLRANHDDVASVCRKVQQGLNAKAKAGLGALVPDFNMEKARGLAIGITDAEEVTPDYFRRLVVNNSLSVVDETIRQNAEAQEAIGMYVHITRTYDDVGLHDGKDVCQWCMDREGDWDNYQEAYQAGCFERHPGCGCIINYEVGKTRTTANSKYGWRNM